MKRLFYYLYVIFKVIMLTITILILHCSMERKKFNCFNRNLNTLDVTLSLPLFLSSSIIENKNTLFVYKVEIKGCNINN